MAYVLPEKLRNIVPYAPGGEGVPVRLDANESFLAPSGEIWEEILERIAALKLNRYPDMLAGRLLALAGARYGVSPDLLTGGCGSDELIGLIFTHLLSPGDTCAFLMPDFSMYEVYANQSGVKGIDVGADLYAKQRLPGEEDSFVDTVIARVKKSGAKLFILSNPCNPTSLLIGREEMRRIHDALPDVLLISDEAYMEFAREAGSLLSLVEKSDHLIVLRTCSKAFGMAGIRLGFAAAPRTITNALRAVKAPYNLNVFTQAAGEVLFSHPEYLDRCIETIIASREALYAMVSQIAREKGWETDAPQTNFVLLRTGRDRKAAEYLKERGISVRTLSCGIRITAGSETENAAVVAALREF
ncbi:MAG: histidinol-phosphate aminotransferase family protein [Lachnospiraceae bacterium]|nr:histidinol-phosphate aminotransferase family protein [Lachnospiraceae bacterium]